jgi:hypothetical protein
MTFRSWRVQTVNDLYDLNDLKVILRLWLSNYEFLKKRTPQYKRHFSLKMSKKWRLY